MPPKAKEKPTLVVNINTFSDGKPLHVSQNTSDFEDTDALIYREKLAALWMKERNELNPGIYAQTFEAAHILTSPSI